MNVGDTMEMANLCFAGDEPIVVVVLEVHLNGKVVVEAAHGPRPRRLWITNPEFLSETDAP